MIDVVSDRDLKELCEVLSRQTVLGIDTEFIREKTFYPLLALVQVGYRGADPLLIDPLKISDWKPFHQILLNHEICKVFHAGRQDLEIFYNQMQKMPNNFFDTQIAAALCGYGDQISYGGLVSRILNVELPKGDSYSDWLKRPLLERQLKYARDDVRYLLPVYERLNKDAAGQHRLEWLKEETELGLHAGLFDVDIDNLWKRVKKGGALKPKNLIVLKMLAAWRYETAKESNKPVRFILSDETLVDLAKIDKLNLDLLHSRRGLSANLVARYGEELVDIHQRARKAPKSSWPTLKEKVVTTSGRSQAIADLAWVLVQQVSRKAQIAPSIVVLKRDLPPLVDTFFKNGDLSKFSVMNGWRREMVGDLLLQLFSGDIQLTVENRNITWYDKKKNSGDSTR